MKNLTFEQGMEIANKIDQEADNWTKNSGNKERANILAYRVGWLQVTIANLLSDPDYRKRLITKYK